jgi:regulator of sigma E protease
VTFLISLVSFLIVFSLMVFVHEFGHFIVAKKSGVRVREFGFGFPFAGDRPPEDRPLTWRIAEDKGGTVYSVNLIPFGGFVNLGENDPDDPTSLVHYPKRVRLAVLFAGPAMNLLLAFVVFAVAALVGYPEFQYGVGVVQVLEDTPAAEAGLLENDIILRVGDHVLEGFTPDDEQARALVNGMIRYVATKADQPITVLVQRGLGQDAQRLEFTVIPRANEEGDGQMGVWVGAAPVRLTRVQAPILEALSRGVQEVAVTLKFTVLIPLEVIRGLLPASAARTVGPMGIARMTGDAVQQSLQVDWAYPILHLVGVLNVAIAITNLLPLPALDGGRIVFILLEAVRGRPISPEKEGLVHGIGLLILFAFLIVVTVQDIFVPLPQGINWADYLY